MLAYVQICMHECMCFMMMEERDITDILCTLCGCCTPIPNKKMKIKIIKSVALISTHLYPGDELGDVRAHQLGVCGRGGVVLVGSGQPVHHDHISTGHPVEESRHQLGHPALKHPCDLSSTIADTHTHTHTHTQSHSLAQEVERVKGPMTCH